LARRERRLKSRKRQHDLKRARAIGRALHRELPRDRLPALARPNSIDILTLEDADREIREVAPVDIYRTLGEAEAALDRIEERELRAADRRNSFSAGLAIGLAAVAVLGVGIVLCYVLFRRRDSDKLSGPQQALERVPEQAVLPAAPATPVYNDSNALEALVHNLQKRDEAARNLRTFMRSYVLPSLTDPSADPIRVVTAGDQPYEVIIRCVEPPGGHAVLARDPNELRVGALPAVSTATTNFSEFPVGDVVVIPSGQFQHLRLRPHEALFAKGTAAKNASTGVAGVIISISAADFLVGG
jgi:hypothetical protein